MVWSFFHPLGATKVLPHFPPYLITFWLHGQWILLGSTLYRVELCVPKSFPGWNSLCEFSGMGLDPCGPHPFPGCPSLRGSFNYSLQVGINEEPLNFTPFSGCNPNFSAQWQKFPVGVCLVSVSFGPNSGGSCSAPVVGSGLCRFIQGIKEWVVPFRKNEKIWETPAPFCEHQIPSMFWCRSCKIQGRIIQNRWNFSGSRQRNWKSWALKSPTAAREDNFESLCTGFSKEKSFYWITTTESKGDLRILNLIIPPRIFKGV